jgi:hypothetical protein
MADCLKLAALRSKDDAAAFEAETGEDFMDLLGYNPLKNSIDVCI